MKLKITALLVAGIGFVLFIGYCFKGHSLTTTQSPAPFALWSDTVDACDFRGIDYGAVVTSACQQDRNALVRLFNLTEEIHGSGAGSYGHGATMIEILWIVGEQNFMDALTSLPHAKQKDVLFILQCGDEYTLVEEHRQKLSFQFPRLTQLSESLQ